MTLCRCAKALILDFQIYGKGLLIQRWCQMMNMHYHHQKLLLVHQVLQLKITWQNS